MLEYQNINAFLLKDIFQIGLKRFFVIIAVKFFFRWEYDINDLNDERWRMLNGHLNLNKLIFLEKELRKTNQEGFRIEKVT